MILIQNCITLCKYLINKTIGFMEVGSIYFEYIDEDDDDREICYCNLCYTFRYIILFAIRKLKYKRHKIINKS